MLVNKGSGEQYILRFANAVLMRMCRVDENRSHRQGGCNFFFFFFFFSRVIRVQE